MKRTLLIAAFVISVVLLAAGLLFLCAATREPGRLPLSLVLLLIGGGLAAWSALTWRREQELEPKRLADSIIDLARAGGGAEVSLAQIVAELNVPTEAAQRALGVLERRGECRRERRAGWQRIQRQDPPAQVPQLRRRVRAGERVAWCN